jgi:hypothetical protein
MPRPRLKPTEEQRRMVKSMAAMGIRQENIACVLKIRSTKTLRKFFREELDRGLTEATFNMEQAQYKNGMAGNIMAQINWLSRHKRCLETASPPAALAPFIVSVEKEPTEKGQP